MAAKQDISRKLGWTVRLLTALGIFFLTLTSFGRWGAASIDGDRVKWGLTGIDRLRGGPDVHIIDSCRWHTGATGLCALDQGYAWAEPFFAVASVVMVVLAAGALLGGLLTYSRPRVSVWVLMGSWVMTILMGLVSLHAAEGILIYLDNGVDAVGWGALDWRLAVAMLGSASLLALFGVRQGRALEYAQA